MLKIQYIANVRMPTEKAHGIQIVKTCEALAKAGADVELIVPDRTTHITEDVAAYYGLKSTIPITRLNVPDVVSWGSVGFFIESVLFGIAAALEARRRDILVYGRDEIVLAIVAFLTDRGIVWESHTGAWSLFARYVASRAKKIIVISNGLRDFYISRGIPREKIIVAHDGVDLDGLGSQQGVTSTSKKEARAHLRLSQNAKIAMYIGALGLWKGTDTLLEASNLLPIDIQIAIISNSQFDAKKNPRVLFLGERPYKEIARNQQAADVLVLPTSGNGIIGAKYTSPLKLFTYMASGIPIAASDVPSTKEVLPENAAFWFKADNPGDLARAIHKALSDSSAQQKASLARETVSLYTWDERAKRILPQL